MLGSVGVLHGPEQLIDGLSLFVIRLAQLFVIGDGRERSAQIIQFEVGQREIEVDERKARLDLGGSFIVQPRQRKLTGVEVKIAEVVVGLNVSRFMLQSKREVIQSDAHVSQILVYDSQVAISL